MFVLFEEAGKCQAGRVLSEAPASLQVELDSGKRLKLKAAQALLHFESPPPAAFLAAAQALGETIELDLAWEFAPDDEFGFADLAREYFSATASLTQQAAALLRLHEAPHYFRRAGKGRFRKASAEVVQQALAGIEKRRLLQLQIEAWAAQLIAGECPAPVAEQLYKILFKPDKNAPEYKAVVEAARRSQTAPLALLQKAGAIRSAYQFHWRRFLFENFPKGTGFPTLQAPAPPADLPLAAVQAFSIDDSSTTEIDDALSVSGLGSGCVTVGIHIAAPGLGLQPGSPLDQVARERYSTVYMPGHKITMLPEAVVQSYTLQEGQDCAAVSLYLRLDEQSLALQSSETRLERVPIAANLRHDQLDSVLTEAHLLDASLPLSQPVFGREALGFLFRLARHLKAGREQVRGKPENFNRPDYNFKLVGVAGEPQGTEAVQMSTRQRGAPLDLIVAEAMILANSHWGQWLAEHGVPGIYRSQASLAPGVKVRMGTKAAPHAGLGVACYAWSTSPLRRYTDLVNQWQIIACARHGKAAALAAPFKAKDAGLFSIISGFDAAYASYNSFQAGIERYWTLQYLRQQGIEELEGSLFREGLLRADALPLVVGVMGGQNLPRGARLRLRLGSIDDITLDLNGTVIERLDDKATETEAEEGEEPSAGPIIIALDASEAPPPADDNAAP